MWFVRRHGYGKVKSTGERVGLGLSAHLENMRRIIWPELDGEHNGQRWHKLCRDNIADHKITVLMGPGSCVVGETRLLDPTTGTQLPIAAFCKSRKRPMVMTLDGPKLAKVPFLKGHSELVRVTLQSGKEFISTPGHLVLTEYGFRAVSSLRIGQSLLAYERCQHESISGLGREWSIEDARHLWKTTEGCTNDYRSSFRSYDAPLHYEKVTDSSDVPSRLCALKYSYPSQTDDLERESARTRFYPEAFHLSNSDVFPLGFHSQIFASLHSESERSSHGAGLFSRQRQFASGKIHFLPLIERARISSRSYSVGEKPCEDYRVLADMVKSVKPAGSDFYYDLQVPGAHHYFAEGTIHHNSGKTHEAAWTALCRWMANPTETCVLVSSTDIRGLRLRVWGEISMLWQRAIQRFDFLPGHMLDSKLAITAETLDDDGDENDRLVRDFRSAIIGIPTVQNGKQIGLGKWIGLKQKHVILVADEAQFMGPSFLSAFANLNKNERFNATVLGNPNDTLDPLGKAAEPLDGWDDHMEPDKTSVWKTRFMEGVCVNLIGTDSPNFDFPEGEPPRFKYLINRQTIAETLSFFARDSFEYYSQCVGAMKIGSLARRVLTRRICEQGNALDTDVNWQGSPTTKVYYVDAAYGGDRCIGGWGEFGKTVAGDTVLLLHQPVNIPISVRADKEPEQQIAEWMKRECEGLGIPPENAGHDSTGRGSLGTFLARVWSAFVQPIEAGGQPTDRPVSQTHYIRDPKTRARRLKTCKEHYVKLVTEFWFSVRYTVEAGQLRGLTEEAMEELCQRQWDRVKDDKIEVETKQEMKERIGRSPDLGDWVAGIVEMARRKGFEINKLLNTEEHADTRQWLYAIREQHDEMMARKQLNHAA